MSQAKESFDLIVIGAGPGGYVCAIRAAQLGLKVACIEASETLGGTCLNVGCVPSKAMLESSHHFHLASHGLESHGISFDSLKLDLKKMLGRKEKVVETTVSGIEFLFKKNKITRIKGLASLKGPGQVQVTNKSGDNELFSAKNIVIATGSTPVQIPPAPFDHANILDSTDALSLKKVPKHLIVVGGGVIGLELGSVWLRLGAKVTVIEALDKILGATDHGISKEMLKILKKQGMEFHLKTSLKSTKVDGDQVLVRCETQKGEALDIRGDKVLISVGRRPVTEPLQLDSVGIKKDSRGFIQVNERYETSVPGIYAIGDVIPGPMLAHKAEEEGVAAAEFIAGQKGHVNYSAVASIVYTWPEIASVGQSEEECKNQKIPYKTGKFYFKANARAKAMDSTEGYVKIISHKESDKLLGIHIIGPMASEMIAEAAIAFEYGASAEDIARSVHAHPTLSEVMKEAALDVEKLAIHS